MYTPQRKEQIDIFNLTMINLTKIRRSRFIFLQSIENCTISNDTAYYIQGGTKENKTETSNLSQRWRKRNLFSLVTLLTYQGDGLHYVMYIFHM